jgi:hypothetical protein
MATTEGKKQRKKSENGGYNEPSNDDGEGTNVSEAGKNSPKIDFMTKKRQWCLSIFTVAFIQPV